MSGDVQVCSICGFSLRRCVGHPGLRAHIAAERRVFVTPEEWEDGERRYAEQWERWRKRESDAAGKRGKERAK
jgi:hypothetical protein